LNFAKPTLEVKRDMPRSQNLSWFPGFLIVSKAFVSSGYPEAELVRTRAPGYPHRIAKSPLFSSW